MIEQIDAAGQRASLVYSQYLRALTGVVSSAIAGRDALEPRGTLGFDTGGYNAMAALESALRIVEDGEVVMALAIASAGELDDENRGIIRAHCMTALYDAKHSVTRMSADDLAAARKLFRQFIFDVNAKKRFVAEPGALVAVRIRYLPVEVDKLFGKRDRAGRNWRSTNYVGTAIRGVMVNTYVDAYLFTLLARGVSKARVTYEDPEHENNGLIFSIDGSDPSIPRLDQIRTQVFHPNSTAGLEPA